MSSRKRARVFYAFSYGVVSAFDLGLRAPGELPCMPRMRTPKDDAKALAGDWRRVGDALRAASKTAANDEPAREHGERSRTGS